MTEQEVNRIPKRSELTDNEKMWFNLFEEYCKKTNSRYVVSWHIRCHYGYSTNRVNYNFDKLVKIGLLKKESGHQYTKFYYAEDTEHPKN